MNNKKKCFVIMPFSETDSLAEGKWTEIFEHEIKPAVEESGFSYKCERYKFRRANITKDILQELNSALVVIADLTDNNPNVLWELGVRHTLSKRTILIAQDKKFLPSDLKDYPIITYKYKQRPAEVSKFRREIKDKLEDIEADPDKPDNPVADFLEHKNIDLLSSQKSENCKKLTALVSELSENLDHVEIVLKEATNNRKLRKNKKREEGIVVSTVRFDTTCLDLLISTHYVTLSKDTLQSALKAREHLKISNARLDCWHERHFAESIEEGFIEFLPVFKEDITTLLKEISTIRVDYINDNYEEPSLPPPILSRPAHQEYIKST